MLNHGLLHPYSLSNNAAVMNAVAVCPEGKELYFEPSGLSLPIDYLPALTIIAMEAAENALDVSILPHEERLS